MKKLEAAGYRGVQVLPGGLARMESNVGCTWRTVSGITNSCVIDQDVEALKFARNDVGRYPNSFRSPKVKFNESGIQVVAPEFRRSSLTKTSALRSKKNGTPSPSKLPGDLESDPLIRAGD